MKSYLILLLSLLVNISIWGQDTTSTCDPSTPSFTFDLTGNPDSAWVSEQIRRDGVCCDVDPNEKPPPRCTEFFFTLDSAAVGIIFDIETGAVPPGALFFQINCEGRYQFGELLCLDGPGPFRLTFCKPGNNPNTYIIKSVGPPEVSPPITVSDGCGADLFAWGYDLSTVKWSSVPDDPFLNSLLSCTEQCDSVHASYQIGAPDSVLYQVSGIPIGGCSPTPIVLQTWVYFVNDKKVEILPKDAAICFGQTTADLTAFASGGKPPYKYVWNTGDTTQSISVGLGEYWVEVFDGTSCPTTMDTVNVGAFLFEIEADAGIDTTVCAENPTLQLNGSIQEALGGKWSGGQGTFSPNDSTLNATYVATQDEVLQGNINLTLTTTGNRSCPGDSDNVVISFTPIPNAQAGNDQIVCANNSSVQLQGNITNALGGKWSGGLGTFLPNDSTLNAVYLPNDSEIQNGTIQLYLTTQGNGTCDPNVDTLDITITPAPTVTVLDDEICANNPTISLQADVTVSTGIIWTNGTGIFSPNNTELVVNYTLSDQEIQNGQVTLIATSTGNGDCLPISSPINITVLPSPIVEAGPNQTFCANNINIQLDGNVQHATGGEWSGGQGSFDDITNLQTSYTPSSTEIQNGNVILTLTSTGNGDCLPISDQIVITFLPEPIIDAGPNQSVCDNNASINLLGSIQNATGVLWSSSGTGTFSPNNTDLNANYIASTTDTTLDNLTIQITSTGNGLCLAVEDIMTLNMTPAPVIDAGDPQTVCENNPEVQLNGNVLGNFEGVWSGGQGIFSPNNTDLNANYNPSTTEIENKTITLVLTSTNNGNCNPVSDQMIISVIDQPIVDLGNNISICADQNQIQVNANLQNATQGIWSGGQGTFTNATNINTIYNATQNEIEQDSLVNLTFTTTQSTPCLEEDDQLLIKFTPIVEVEAGPSQSICTGTDDVFLNGQIKIAGGATWTTSGNGTFANANDLQTSYSPSSDDFVNGSITLTLTTNTNGTCNPYSDNVVINFVTGPSVDVGADQTICTNDFPIQLNAVGSPGQWTGNGGTFDNTTFANAQYIPSDAEIQSGTINLTFTTNPTALCPAVPDTIEITLLEGPEIASFPNQIICSNENSIGLNATLQNANSISWATTGSGTITNNTNINTTYNLDGSEQNINDTLLIRFTVTTTNNGLCPAEQDIMEVRLIPTPEVNAGNDQFICGNNSVISLNGSFENAGGITWSTSGNGTFNQGNENIENEYNITSNDTTTKSVTFTLTTTDNGVCPAVSDQKTIQFQSVPIVRVGNDISLCEDVQNISLTASVTHATGVTWNTSNGNGLFSPTANELNTTYIRADQDTLIDPIKLFVASTGNGVCGAVYDTLNLIFTPKVVVQPGFDLTVCGDSSFIELTPNIINATGGTWSTSGNGTFENNTLQNLYYPSEEDVQQGSISITLTSTGNGSCNASSNDLTITFTSIPTINAGADIIICEDSENLSLSGNVQIATGGIWTSNGKGNFDNANNLSTSYNVHAEDTLLTTLELYVMSTGNGQCKPVYDTLKVDFTPKPTVNVGEDLLACYSDNAINLQSTITIATGGNWTSTGNGVFTPSTNLLNTQYNFTANDKTQDSLIFVLSSTGNGSCKAYTDTLAVHFTNPPTIDLGDGTICANTNGGADIQAITTNAVSWKWSTLGTGTFSPSDTILNPEYIPSTTDKNGNSITLVFTATSCASVSKQVEFKLLPAPTLSINNDDQICENSPSQLTSSISNATGVLWTSTGGGSFSPSNTSINPTYTASAADIINKTTSITAQTTGNGECSPTTKTTTIIILPKPIVNTKNGNLICTDQDEVDIEGSISGVVNGTWTTSGNGIFANQNEFNTTYTLSAADKTKNELVLTLTSAQELCHQPVSSIVTIPLQPKPIISAGNDQIACKSDDAVFFNGFVQNANGVKWVTTGSGSFSSTTSSNTKYTFSEADKLAGEVSLIISSVGQGICKAVTDHVKLSLVDVPQIEVGENLFYCAEMPLFDVNATIDQELTNDWEWFSTGNGDFTKGINELEENSYQTTAGDTLSDSIRIFLTVNINTGCVNTDYFDVYFFDNPSMKLGEDEGCDGDTLELIAQPINVNKIGTYNWYRNDTLVQSGNNPVLLVTNEGNYAADFSLGTCGADAKTEVIFRERPIVTNENEAELCTETSNTVTLDAGQGTDSYSYEWFNILGIFDDLTQQYLTVNDIGTYFVKITNEYDCSIEDSILVKDACPPRVFVPTIFTPNEDGQNDLMIVDGAYFRNYNLTIFNRWGEIIFYTEDRYETWDGKYRGEDMPIGVYNWIVKYEGQTESFKGPYTQKGSITIVR